MWILRCCAVLFCALLMGCDGALPIGGTAAEPAAVVDPLEPPKPQRSEEPEETAPPNPQPNPETETVPLGELTPRPEIQPITTPEEPPENTAERLACTKKKGILTKTPAGFYLCVQNTGQGQKACTSSNQCDGVCLARSGTCSPFNPLIGCNEIITSGGGMATLCID